MVPYLEGEWSFIMGKARKLRQTIGSSFIRHGVWMAPLKKTDGTLMWSKFDDDPSSHVLILYTPDKLNHAKRFLDGMSLAGGVHRIDVGRDDTPAEMRRKISTLARIVDQGQAILPCTVIIHDLVGIFENLRRDSSKQIVHDDITTIINRGPSVNIHLIILQDSSDTGLSLLSKLKLNAGNGVVMGRLTPLSCELAFGRQVEAARVKRSSKVAWAYTNKGQDTGLVVTR